MMQVTGMAKHSSMDAAGRTLLLQTKQRVDSVSARTCLGVRGRGQPWGLLCS